MRFNKKGEVPIFILVLEVILLCALVVLNATIFSFSNVDSGGLENIVVLERCSSLAEQYFFYKNNIKITGYSFEQIKELPVFKKNGENLIVPEGGNNFLICNAEGIKIKYLLD
jgi:hypothetical protein